MLEGTSEYGNFVERDPCNITASLQTFPWVASRTASTLSTIHQFAISRRLDLADIRHEASGIGRIFSETKHFLELQTSLSQSTKVTMAPIYPSSSIRNQASRAWRCYEFEVCSRTMQWRQLDKACWLAAIEGALIWKEYLMQLWVVIPNIMPR